MTYQSAATDTPYTGNLYNLALYLYQVLGVLKGSLKAAGFVVTQSGDGLATFSTSADILTGEAVTDTGGFFRSNDGSVGREKIANSMGNDRCWLVVKPNASATYTGQLCIQIIDFGSGSWNVRIKFSPGGFANATSATQTPAPTTGSDEKYCCGGGTNASPTGEAASMSDNGFRCNTTFDNAVATPRGWFGCWNATTDGCRFLLLWDNLGNLGESDTYPYVVSARPDLASNNVARTTILTNQTTTQDSGVGGVTKRGSGLAEYTAALYPMAVGLPAEGTINNLGVNTLVSKSDLIPLMYARCGYVLASPLGWKGVSTMLRWKPTNRPNADHYDSPTGGAARDFVVIQDLSLPWAVAGTACVR